jgi:ADP-ribosyl-[dinitrogen reductase] hydrolase
VLVGWDTLDAAPIDLKRILAVNLGDDADTTGPVYGQLAGAFYGETGIPEAWRSKLAARETISEIAVRLFALAQPYATAGS